jgi:hypothetical protein
MSIDNQLEEAVRAAVEDQKQSAQLASYLLAWLNAVISGNEDLANEARANHHLDLLYGETTASLNIDDEGN